MARKWALLLRAVESVLRRIHQWISRILFSRRGYFRLVVVMLLGMFILTVEMPMVLSQMTGARQIAQNLGEAQKLEKQDIKQQIDKIKQLQSEGRYYTACETLIKIVLPFSTGLTCDDLEQKYGESELTYWQEIKNNITNQNNETQVVFWFYFGENLRVIGDLDKSQEALEKGLEVAKNVSPDQEAVISLSLANTFRAKGNLERDRLLPPQYDYLPWQYVDKISFIAKEEYKKEYDSIIFNYENAFKKYENAAEISQSIPESKKLSILYLTAQVNRISLMIELEQVPNENDLLNLKDKLSNLPVSLEKVYIQISFFKSLVYLQQLPNNSLFWTSWKDIVSQLECLTEEARKLSNQRAESYVLGNLGGLYEYEYCIQKDDNCQDSIPNKSLNDETWKKAQEFTQEALYLAQPSEAPDIAYQWQWQMGRLLKEKGEIREAIPNYQASVNTLKSVRGDLLTINSDVQFSFRDNVEPLYRELVDLLLQIGGENNLIEARKSIDSLRLAELENFVRCKLQNKEQLTNPDALTILIYPIILKNRLEVIVQSKTELRHYKNNHVDQDTVEKTIKQLRTELYRNVIEKELYLYSQQVYNWLIRPIEQEKVLDPKKIKTVVFILDGSFRKIPMASLHDSVENKFLVEKYAIAISAGLELPVSQQNKELKGLIAGQSLDIPGYGPIEYVGESKGKDKSEIRGIETVWQNAKKYVTALLDKELNKKVLENELSSNSHTVIHIATHGQFSSNPTETFIITAPGEQLRLNELKTKLQRRNRKPIELLVFSACETAKGDNRAILGLAGITVQSGVSSTIGTLWSVDDYSTSKLMKQFYQELLNNKLNPAEALQKAQITLLQKKIHDDFIYSPYHWSPYIIVGNWRSISNF
ncbi:CHAT domain-containing protein [Aulosira sp. FACHB-615]|uniref:CHAT domain-containing protein n=1 Tax=Aulosira sp. FACHB-615 TaxID=2692777 RepID=UPI001687CC77|nr:CHAT domain-containing protein [Aulosira sp. FACHB-615]MBD2492323.1 CHAT domain-containing protein [Aulosira sp. FACHB-615]